MLNTTLRFRTTSWERARIAHGRPKVPAGFAKLLRDTCRQTQILYQLLMLHTQGQPIGFECRMRDKNQWAFILPDVAGDGPWRIQRFDEDGFIGHGVHPSLEIAGEVLIMDGYICFDPGALDRVSLTSRWQRGMQRSAIIQSMQGGLISYKEMVAQLSALNRI